MEQSKFQPENIEQDEISIVEIFFHYLRHWKGFLLSGVVCLGLAISYLLYVTPEYKVISRIVISDEKRGQTMDVATAFSDFGVLASKNSFDNEIEILRSQTLMRSVVDSLGIGVSYFKKTLLSKQEIYRGTPVFVSIPNVIAPGSFTVDLVSGGVLSVSSGRENFQETTTIRIPLNTPWGVLMFMENPLGTELYPIEVEIKNPRSHTFLPKVEINPVNRTSSVVELSYVTPTPPKGEDIVNTLILHYNRNAIDDKNWVANSTINFIDERILDVTGELHRAESDLEGFQIQQGITNLQAQGQLLLSTSSEYHDRIVNSEVQLYLLSETQAWIMNPVNTDNTVSSNIGITDPTVISLINKYNEAVLERNRMTAGMTAIHPQRIRLNNQVALIREDLLEGINLSINSIRSVIRELQRQENVVVGRTRELTSQEREARDLFRQQKFRENLFIYLMQKQEETRLSVVTATPNAKIIDYAFHDIRPVKPRKIIVLFAALMLAGIVPVGVIYIKDLFDNKIHTKDDVTRTISAPFLGAIPVKKSEDPFPVLKTRSEIAERFRTVISNLNFVAGNGKTKVITITSYTGGDGKSFFSRNLAMSLAVSGKRTLLIDMDLRKSMLMQTLQLPDMKKGSALFLSNPEVTVSEIIDTSRSYHKNLDIIPVLDFPPNPAELLSSGRLRQLFQEINNNYNYDYIIVDTAPAGLVADIFYINPHSMATIFILRSGYTQKKSLMEVQNLYKESKLNNLCIVLNAMDSKDMYGYGQYSNRKHNYYSDES
jgi:capsular exopolysaccharide synthesis family protein